MRVIRGAIAVVRLALFMFKTAQSIALTNSMRPQSTTQHVPCRAELSSTTTDCQPTHKQTQPSSQPASCVLGVSCLQTRPAEVPAAACQTGLH